MNFAMGGGEIKGRTMNFRISKVAAAVIAAVVLLALCAGVTLLVANHINAHNLAVQQAAATASHNRAKAQARTDAMNKAIAAANHKADKAARAARQATRAASHPVVVVPATAAAAPAAGLTPAGIGTQGEEVYAGPNTSAAFALNVESDYWQAPGMQFTSYSPVTGQSYFMTATDSGNSVTVTGGNGALVEFSDGS
jgi:hypothetical protein